jgi:SAM-dependent methyltransferase
MFDAELEAARVRVRRLRRHLPRDRPPVVLEVGSFVGGFLAAASELGWQAVGLDPGKEVVEFCRSKGLRVQRSAAEDAPIGEAVADCVAIWNTFDQLPDPRDVLAAARRWLRPGGILVIRAPNGATFRGAMRYRRSLPFRAPLLAALAWNNLLGFPYLYGYSPPPLDRLVRGFGFARRDLRGDTLVRLADDSTRPWAVAEERLVKALWGAAARVAPSVAPWFEAYYSRSSADRHLRPT